MLAVKNGFSLPKVLKEATVSSLGSELRPTSLRTILKLLKSSGRMIRDYTYDLLRFARYSSTFHYRTRENSGITDHGDLPQFGAGTSSSQSSARLWR